MRAFKGFKGKEEEDLDLSTISEGSLQGVGRKNVAARPRGRVAPVLVGRQSTTKADSPRLKGGWKSEIGRPLVQPPSSFYSRGVTSPADYVNPASKTITIPGVAEARSLPFHLPIPSPGAATRSSLLLALRNSRPPRPTSSHLSPPFFHPPASWHRARQGRFIATRIPRLLVGRG